MNKYEVQYWDLKFSRTVSREFDTESEARAYAKRSFDLYVCEQVTMIKWHVEPNLPGRKPDMVYKSVGMSILRSDGWHGAHIHGPEPYSTWKE